MPPVNAAPQTEPMPVRSDRLLRLLAFRNCPRAVSHTASSLDDRVDLHPEGCARPHVAGQSSFITRCRQTRQFEIVERWHA